MLGGRHEQKYKDGIVRVPGGRMSPAKMVQQMESREEWQALVANVRVS